MRNFQDMLQTPTTSQGYMAFPILDGSKYSPVPERQHVKRLIKLT